jgi:hypothetical protein
VKEDGPRAAGEAAIIGISLCQATAAVHQAGVLHRDIKAHNVIREAGGRIVLMDFGAGQMLGAGTDGERLSGTPAYMAPEVLAGGRATVRSDIYSLGVLLYYLVTGTYPVEGHSWTDFILKHARFERRPLGDVRPDVPARFVRIVERATALSPDDRYATPGAMLADLTAVVAGGAGGAARRATRTDSRRRRGAAPEPKPASKRWMIAAATAGPVLAIWALGAITSVAFNHTLGRSAEYSGETPFSWWIWGVRALIPGAVQATAVVLLWTMLAAVWKVLSRMLTPAARLGEALRARRGAVAARTGLDDPDTAAQALLAAQLVAVTVFCWYFRDIFSASFSFIAWATPQEVEALRPERLERHQLYNFSMAMLILAMAAGLRLVLRMRRRAGGPAHSTIPLVAGVIGVSFVVLVYPYRLIWHNDAEAVTYGTNRCYLLGERPPSGLLYCPDVAAPKIREVALSDGQLNRSGQSQSIYTR